jgi:hypothetical protein
MRQASLVYQLAALQKLPRVIIPCNKPMGHSALMKTISGHFLRSPELKGIKYRQRALYCVMPNYGANISAVMIERHDADITKTGLKGRRS